MSKKPRGHRRKRLAKQGQKLPPIPEIKTQADYENAMLDRRYHTDSRYRRAVDEAFTATLPSVGDGFFHDDSIRTTVFPDDDPTPPNPQDQE